MAYTAAVCHCRICVGVICFFILLLFVCLLKSILNILFILKNQKYTLFYAAKPSYRKQSPKSIVG